LAARLVWTGTCEILGIPITFSDTLCEPGKTRSARLRRACKAVWDWCRRYRHESIEVQHAALTRRIQGHFNYFGVNGNGPSLAALVMAAERAWYTWLRKRSQRMRLTWGRFSSLLEVYPLPAPLITVQIWGA
jgi:hypothetical protein